MKLLLVQLKGKKEETFIIEEHVCRIDQSAQDGNVAIIGLTNGDKIECESPSWEEWYNDYLKQNN